MQQKLPKSLLNTLVALSIGSFAISMYLEWFQFDFLQRHPITVNLISGVVGFSTGALCVAIGFNWFVKREDFINRRREFENAHFNLYRQIALTAAAIPGECFRDDPRTAELTERPANNVISFLHYTTLDWWRYFEGLQKSIDVTAVADLTPLLREVDHWLNVVSPEFAQAFDANTSTSRLDYVKRVLSRPEDELEAGADEADWSATARRLKSVLGQIPFVVNDHCYAPLFIRYHAIIRKSSRKKHYVVHRI